MASQNGHLEVVKLLKLPTFHKELLDLCFKTNNLLSLSPNGDTLSKAVSEEDLLSSSGEDKGAALDIAALCGWTDTWYKLKSGAIISEIKEPELGELTQLTPDISCGKQIGSGAFGDVLGSSREFGW